MSTDRNRPLQGAASGDARAGEDARAPKGPRGWHGRGYLPHFDGAGRAQFVTYRLADALPTDVVERLQYEAATVEAASREYAIRRAYRAKVEQFLGAGHGACWLRQPDVAHAVVDAWFHSDGERYDLREWVVMPNHVHVIVTPASGTSLSDIVQGWKSFTARQINRLLGRTGTMWQADYWDTYIRDDDHLAQATRYIRHNPVKANLCAAAEDWPWSSASRARASSPASSADAEAGKDARAPTERREFRE
jgi:REP element-mobilizing transposase RayT